MLNIIFFIFYPLFFYLSNIPLYRTPDTCQTPDARLGEAFGLAAPLSEKQEGLRLLPINASSRTNRCAIRPCGVLKDYPIHKILPSLYSGLNTHLFFAHAVYKKILKPKQKPKTF